MPTSFFCSRKSTSNTRNPEFIVMNMKKVMLFAYDGTGLGHLMRLIKIAWGIQRMPSDSSVWA